MHKLPRILYLLTYCLVEFIFFSLIKTIHRTTTASGLVTTHVVSPFQAYKMANHQTAAMSKHFTSCTSTTAFVLLIVVACARLATSASTVHVHQVQTEAMQQGLEVNSYPGRSLT